MKTRLTRSRALFAVVMTLGASMLGGDCDGNIVQDPTFRDWCGAKLCAWQTDYGQIKRVPTWNAKDFGVSFLDDTGGTTQGTEISQATEESQATCLLFTSVGDIDPNAQMELRADFDSDGTVDYVGPLGAATWHKVQTEITAPAAYRGITFYLRKNGTGTAVLAEMTIQSTTGCTPPARELKNLRLGDKCGVGSTCAAGLVCPSRGFQICGECSAESPCAGGVECKQRSVFLPNQCGPGLGLGQTGAPCLARSDCASGICAGASPYGLASLDAAPCDLNAIGPNDTTNCAWDGAYGGTCQ